MAKRRPNAIEVTKCPFCKGDDEGSRGCDFCEGTGMVSPERPLSCPRCERIYAVKDFATDLDGRPVLCLSCNSAAMDRAGQLD